MSFELTVTTTRPTGNTSTWYNNVVEHGFDSQEQERYNWTASQLGYLHQENTPLGVTDIGESWARSYYFDTLENLEAFRTALKQYPAAVDRKNYCEQHGFVITVSTSTSTKY